MRCVIGVDLGGTNVRACAYLEDGTEVGERVSGPSRAQEGADATLDALASVIEQATASAREQPEAVGIAIPGHIDDDAGVVRWAPNFGTDHNGVFRSWRDVPVREPLAKRIRVPIVTGNDANLAALGEYYYGTGRGNARCLVMITLGTGIGGGVVLSPYGVQGDARGPLVLIGGNGGGGELGHVVVNYQGLDCTAGSYGAIESYCGRDGIIRRAQHRLLRDRESILREIVGGDLSKITPLEISAAADRGDELAIEVYEEVGTMLGVGLGNFINIFAPDIVAIGGQIAKAGEWILGPARKAARNVAIPSIFADAKIVVAEQIEDAGMLGGAALAQEAMKWKEPTASR